MALKARVPGTNVIEVQFQQMPSDWQLQLEKLPAVEKVQPESAGMFRIMSDNGSQTTTHLVQLAAQAGTEIKTLSVQNTTLDDVFVHFTGRQLRDEQVKALGFVMPPRPGLQP
jgi:ABC-2 type transport system ATP-binding protein